MAGREGNFVRRNLGLNVFWFDADLENDPIMAEWMSAEDFVPSERRERAKYLDSVVQHFYRRFGDTNDIKDLWRGSRAGEKALEFTDHQSPWLPQFSHNLALLLETIARATDDKDDVLNRALRLSMDAVNGTTEGSDPWLTYSNGIASKLLLKFQLRSDHQDLLCAVQTQKRVVFNAPERNRQRPLFLLNLAVILAQWFKLTGNMYDLQRTAEAFVQVIQCNNLSSQTLYNNLGLFGNAVLHNLGRIKKLDKAICSVKIVLAALALESSCQLLWIICLGALLLENCARERTIESVLLASQIFNSATHNVLLNASEEGEKILSWIDSFIILLLDLFRTAYEASEDLKALTGLINVTRRSVEFAQDNKKRAVRESALATLLYEKYRIADDLRDLDAAIDILEEVLNDTFPNTNRQPPPTTISVVQHSVSTAPPREPLCSLGEPNPDFSRCLMNLGKYQKEKYRVFGSSDAIDQAIQKYRAAAVTLSAGPQRRETLYWLADVLHKRFMDSLDIGDFKEHMHCWAELEQNEVDEGLRRPRISSPLRKRFLDAVEGLEDLEELVNLLEESVKEFKNSPTDDVNVLQQMELLGFILKAKYRITGDLQCLYAAVKWTEEYAEHLTGVPSREYTRTLGQLSWLYEEIYEYTQNSDSLEYALNRAKECVQLTPSRHPWRALRLSMLGNLYEQKYKHSISEAKDSSQDDKTFEYLEAAIKHGYLSLGASGAIYKSRAACHHNLANKLWLRYKHNGRPEDRMEAISLAEKAVALSSYDEGQTALHINSWAGFISDSERPEDMERAITLFARALDTTPMHHPYDSLIFQNLAETVFQLWRATYQEKGKQRWATAISKAMSTKSLEEVLSEQKTDTGGNEERQDRKREDMDNFEAATVATLRDALDHWLYRSVSQATDNAYLKELRDVLQLNLFAWEETNSPPLVRINAARRVIEILTFLGDFKGASGVAAQAVHLIPSVSSQTLIQEDKQRVLSMFQNITAEACSLALAVGKDTWHALELLELGRGVILGHITDNRRDLKNLERDHPNLARRLANHRAALGQTLGPLGPERDIRYIKAIVSKRQEAAERLQETLRDIRRQPKYRKFALPLDRAECSALAVHGPVVYCVVTKLRSDAIILSEHGINTIQLLTMDHQKVESWMADQLGVNQRDDGKKNKRARNFLWWLWVVAVQPIFKKIGYLNSSEKKSQLSRVWWIGVGLASQLPFHAAGNHHPGSTENTISHAVSSYAPNLKTLAFSREKGLHFFNEPQLQPRISIMAMPTTPKDADLPFSSTRLDRIRKAMNTFTVNFQEYPSVAEAQGNIKISDIVHFSCHGYTDSTDPSRSHLKLMSKSSNEAEKLTFRDISAVGAQRCRLVLLSACSTAVNPASKLADEAIHIASGFQAGGFSHVIASLWPVRNDLSIVIEDCFYRSLRQAHQRGGNHADVARSVHDAVQSLATVYYEDPLAWAPFIHFGA